MSIPKLPALLQPNFDRLTAREQAFVMHPDVFTNPVKAAMAVGYARTTAQVRSYQMRRELMFYIMPLHEARLEKTGVTVDRIKDELAAIAFANEADFYDTVDVETEIDGQLVVETVKFVRDITRLPEHMQRAVKSVEYETTIDDKGQQTQKLAKVVLYDKLVALKELAEIFGLKDPRFRKPTDESAEQAELLEHLEPEELEALAKIHTTAASRAAKKREKILNKRAIPGQVISGKKPE